LWAYVHQDAAHRLGRMENDPWDELSNLFSGAKSGDELPAVAADNVLIAWPPMIEFLERLRPETVLDFGCGGGRLVDELCGRGFRTAGIDRSEKMIEQAREVFPHHPFAVGDASAALELGQFDAIISVMVLQFVEGIERALAMLTGSLNEKGALVFAVHNPAYVERAIERGRRPPFTLTPQGRRTTLALEAGSSIPLFVRTTDEYDEMLSTLGFERTLCSEPPFTQEFIDRFGTGSLDQSEYLILGYERNA
jgi:2-polyprenyl-3-methyl-5-hydroxy-6-metoxy-1,4-benzoquinol methylase